MFFVPIRNPIWAPWPLIGWVIFNFSSETTEQNSTKLYRKQDLNVLYQVCVFRANRKNKMAALASDWLRHFRLSFETTKRNFNEPWQEARYQCPLPSLCFSGQSEKQDGRPGLWLAETFWTSPLKPLKGIIGKVDWKQDLNVLYHVCVFQANRKTKMATMSSDWLRHFQLPLWNRWTEIQRNWQEARSQYPLPSFLFFGPFSKQKCLHWPIPQKGGTFYSGARYVALWASCSTSSP